MVDRLKNSLEELDPQICEKCDREMQWYRSEIQLGNPHLVDHHFYCSDCGTRKTQSTQVKGHEGGHGPRHHSLPYDRREAA